MNLSCGRFELALHTPRIMAVINLTPDSFSDGGRYASPTDALKAAENALKQGAALLDLGAESTRPGAAAISVEEEWRRLAPVLLEAVKLNAPISVDTYQPLTMQRALDAGADMINCIRGFREPGAVEAVMASKAALCAMHMQGAPETMQAAPQYADAVAEVSNFLRERADALMQAGVARERICLDPGFGFGKRLEDNLALLSRLAELCEAGFPLLVGLSRKSMIGAICNEPDANQRLAGSLAAALEAAQRGARILRVHDVRETRDALAVWQAVHNAAQGK
jgi:dihydropteroate synthase